eukprot:2918355-Amphidinium_carterae.1
MSYASQSSAIKCAPRSPYAETSKRVLLLILNHTQKQSSTVAGLMDRTPSQASHRGSLLPSFGGQKSNEEHRTRELIKDL